MTDARRTERLLTAFTGGLLLMDMVGYTALLPLLPELQRMLDISETQVGVLVAGIAYGTLVFGLPMSALAGRLGPRRVMLAGTGVTALAFLLTWWLPSFGWIMAARVLHGISSAAMWIAAPTWVVAATGGHHTARITTRVTGIGMLGTIVGPAFGGWLARPDDLLRSFLVVGMILGILTVAGALATRIIGRVEVKRPPRLRDLVVAWRSPLFVIGGIVVIAGALATSSESVVIVLGLGNRAVSERAMGVLFSVGGFGLAVAQSASYRVFPRRSAPARAAATLLLLGACVGIALLWPTVVGFSTTVLLIPVLAGLAYGVSIAFLADGAEQAGSTVAVGVAYWSILWALGASVGPTVYGWLLESSGEATTLAAVMGATILLGAVAWLYGRARLPLPDPREFHE
jgi:predicted MFS family arabinose efflux permease